MKSISATFRNNYSKFFWILKIELRCELVAIRRGTEIPRDYHWRDALSPLEWGAPAGEKCFPVVVCPFCKKDEEAFNERFFELYDAVNWRRAEIEHKDLEGEFHDLWESTAGVSRIKYSHCGCPKSKYFQHAMDCARSPGDAADYHAGMAAPDLRWIIQSLWAASVESEINLSKAGGSARSGDRSFFQMTNAAAQLKSL